ncbi:hypothetical protein GIB67_014889 [Kingdonia uniflora]|uniref:Uncharacterized protein n=1 Tax=Kingdonia uniflora TaxID=39325 RepID=A0A7J7MT60_9MAGN|nr:hypothetical protein GIB67_014889 [Kingdonia uniflora]
MYQGKKCVRLQRSPPGISIRGFDPKRIIMWSALMHPRVSSLLTIHATRGCSN